MATPDIFFVQTSDESRKAFKLAASSKVAELEAAVKAQFGFKTVAGFAICEVTSDEYGTIDRWLDPEATLSSEGLSKTSKLEFKPKIIKDFAESQDDEVWLRNFVAHIKRSVLDGTALATERLAARLAGSQLQFTFGDFSEERHKPGMLLKLGLQTYLPIYVSRMPIESWEARLLQLYKSHTGVDKVTAMRHYLQSAKRNPFYGMTMFAAQDFSDQTVRFCVAEDGIYVFDSRMTLVIRVRYEDMSAVSGDATTISISQNASTTHTFKMTTNFKRSAIELMSSYLQYYEVRGLTVAGLRPQAEPLYSTIPSGVDRDFQRDTSSRLEIFKRLYLAMCEGNGIVCNLNICRQVDTACDLDQTLTTLSLAGEFLDARHGNILKETFVSALAFQTPLSLEENMKIDKISFKLDDLSNIDAKALRAVSLGLEDKASIVFEP